MMFCLAQGMRGGPRPAVAASAGISAGSMANVALAGLGLGALVGSLPGLFDAIRWAGIAYLLWLALRTLRAPLGAAGTAAVRPARAFRDGFLVNISNPKVILFVIFGSVIAIGGFVINAAVGLGAGGLGRAMARDLRVERVLRLASASVFGLLAAKLAWDSRT
jgi:threonine/homoserine/homoserine lactone efflux protein